MTSRTLTAFAAILLFFAGGWVHSSAQSVSVNLSGVSVTKALSEIQKASGYSIVIKSTGLDMERMVSVHTDGEDIRQVLAKVFEGQSVDIVIEGKQVSVSKAEQERSRTAQPRDMVEIKGHVTDENGEPLIGAGVLPSAGLSGGTITDIDGNYSIKVPREIVSLTFSFLSYASKEVVVGGRTVIDVQLMPDEKNLLNEIVVVGYGTTRKADLTGSVTTVKIQDIQDLPNTTIDQALQGRLAGVDIMNTSGEPGAATSIRIRGTRSINASNEPLIIVDGVMDAVSDMGEINSADIASISVMKDASSTAIYGSRGANGVILITTKKGTTSKPAITAKAQFGVSMLARELDLMNKDEFLRYQNDRYYFNNPNAAPRYNPEDFKSDTNWIKAITRVAPYQEYNVSVSSKVADRLTFYGAASYTDNQGIVKDSGQSRITGRFNVDYNFAKWLNVALKMNATFRKDHPNKAYIGGTHYWDGAIYLAPTIGENDIHNPLYENGTAINTPLANIRNIEYEKQMLTTNTTLEFTIRPCKGLTIKSQNNLMIYQRHDYEVWPSTLPKRVEGEGADAYRYEGDAKKFSTENTVTYTKKFRSGHNLDLLGGFSASTNFMNYFSLKAEGLLTDDLKWNNIQGIASKENLTPNTASEKVNKMSAFARVNYNYKSRYYLTATGRFDGASNFARSHKWGFFPSAAFKWSIKNEPWMKNVRQVSDLSLRISAGRTGNDAISYYRSLDAYTMDINGYLFGGSQGASVYPNRVANPNLTWEKTDLYNLAIEGSFFKDRLGIVLEAYHSETRDLLLYLKTIQSTGYSSRLTNLGRTNNTGVELTINSRNIQKKHFGWTTDLTLSHNTQRVLDIGQEDYVSVLNSPGNNSFMMYGYKKGYPLNALWGFQYAGVWHNVDEWERNKVTRSYVSNTTVAEGASAKPVLGWARYIDQNNDGILSQEDLVYMGNSDPILYGGLQNTFHIHNLTLSLFFSFSIGGKIYNWSELSMAGTYTANQYRYMENAWHPVRNPESNIPRAGAEARMLPSDFMIHDASYLRLKNASISYKFDFSKKSKVFRDLTLTLTGTNLFLVTPYNGFDPDVSTNSSSSTLRRVDMGAYPQSRMVVFGATLRL